jgi:hypothetical protein
VNGRNLKAACGAILMGVCVTASPADLSRWFEVRGGDWRVDRALWSTIQDQLQPAAEAWSRGGGRGRRLDLSTYVVQLQGQREGHWWAPVRVIRLWGICEIAAKEIHPRVDGGQLYFVDDGGPCFFSAIFDPQTKRLTSFMPNGPY